MTRAVEKYLAGYAEPEASLAVDLPDSYECVLVVPVCREQRSLLNGFAGAAQSAIGRILCVLVVNGRQDASALVHDENERFISEVVGAMGSSARPLNGTTPAWFGHDRHFDILLVDRATDGHRFPRKHGVGLARKIGADIGLAAYRAGKTGRWIFFADADATLPRGYFGAARDVPGRGSALVFSFWHAASGDEPTDLATALYEVSLRYYVLALASAGSPYAMHTLGSAMAVAAEAYASARGVPRREAAEDFYLLNKLAKLGPVLRMDAHVVELTARRSDRTPFGTGRAVERLMAHSQSLKLYEPRSFEILASWIAEMNDFARHTRVDRLLSVTRWAGVASEVILETVQRAGGSAALERLARQSKGTADLLFRMHAWFDGFRTLKLIHALRDAHFPAVPWQEAVLRAGFCDDGPTDDLAALRHRLRCRERAQPREAGPLCLAAAPGSIKIVQNGARLLPPHGHCDTVRAPER